MDLRNQKPFFRYLDTNGDGTGTKNANGDYSITAEEFYTQPPPGEVFYLTRLIVSIEDSGALNAGGYGGGAALSNGITITKEENGTPVIDLVDGIPIDHNGAWGRYAFDTEPVDFGTGNKFFHVRWTFERTGTLIVLSGNELERLVVGLSDDLSGLASHYFQIQGHSNNLEP